MSSHIIPQDSYNHIQDIACGCNPTIVISEGEEMYIHKEINLNIEWLLQEFNNSTKRIKDKYFK